MRKTSQVFHLAIPTHDLALAAEFYSAFENCKVARTYEDRVTVNFFGDQIVCHLAPDKIDRELELYPRHFGITFLEPSDWERTLQSAKDKKIPFFKEPFSRFQGKREEHRTFVLVDPSNNLIEFKYYNDPDMAY